MTNTRRNTMILTILLILLSGAAYSIFHNMKKKADELTTSNQITENKISVLESQISNIDSLKLEYEIRNAMLAEQSKVIVSADTPTSTYQYLLQILSWMKRSIVFDFAMSDKSKVDVNWNEYIISGRTDYRDVWEFTRNIEYQRSLITIEDLTISSDGAVKSDTVSFSMVLRTHFNPGGVDVASLKPKKMPPAPPFFQLFRTRIYDSTSLPSDIDPTLVILEQCKLIGITENQIFVRNEQGIIKILALRDKVAYGYLYAIDLKKGRARFMINKFGIPEEQILELSTTK